MKKSQKEFEATEVYKKKELKKIRATGYEAYRVSPRTTTMYGKKYRKVYGAVVEPDYSRPIGKPNKYGNPTKFGAKVTWSPHYFTSSSAKAGTRVIMPLKDYPIDVREAGMKLMIKKKKRKGGRR